MTPELREFVQEAHARVRQRHLARQRDWAAADQPHIRDGLMRGAKWPAGDQGRAPIGQAGDVRERVVSRASATRIAGKMVVRRRASLDVPAPGGPKRRTLGSERLHHLYLWVGIRAG
jgi:hypothetical protein